MLGLWVLTRVSDEKRQELVQALNSFVAASTMRPCRRFVLEDLNDENLVGWLGYWRTGAELEGFLGSETFRAIKGAVETLGHLEEVQHLTLHSVETREPSKGKET